MISMPISRAAAILSATYQGRDVRFCGCTTDTRTLQRGQLFFALHGQNSDGHDYLRQAKNAGASAVVTERECGELMPSILVDDTRRALGGLAAGWLAGFNIPLVAITGSNGKTTVKEMLASILRCQAEVLATRGNLNNDIGVPLTLFCLGDKHQYAVIEMGANHPGEIEYLAGIARPAVAAITQCAPAHLEGFGSIQGVARAKSEIFSGLPQDGTAIINGDDEFAGLWLAASDHVRQLVFGLGDGHDITARSISLEQDRVLLHMLTPDGDCDVSLKLLGRHNVMNALAASACAFSLGVDLTTIKRGLESVAPIKGRLQIKRGPAQCRVIDDTYNANPGSLQAGLDVLNEFAGEHWLVIGDMGELGRNARALHKQAGLQSRQSGVKHLYAMGELSRLSVQSFGKGAHHFNSHEQLAMLLNEKARPDVTILFKGSRSMKMEDLFNYFHVEI